MKEKKLGSVQKWILRCAYDKEKEFKEATQQNTSPEGKQRIERFFTTADIYVDFYNLDGRPASNKQRVTVHNSLKSLAERVLITKNHGKCSSKDGRTAYCLTWRGRSVAQRVLTSERMKQRHKEEKKEKKPEERSEIKLIPDEIKLTPEKKKPTLKRINGIVRLVREYLEEQSERF